MYSQVHIRDIQEVRFIEDVVSMSLCSISNCHKCHSTCKSRLTFDLSTHITPVIITKYKE